MGQFQDLTGMRFGRWTVKGLSETQQSANRRWQCVCDCGVVKDVYGYSLRQGQSRSCGCLLAERSTERCFVDLVGEKFGRLKVVAYEGRSERGSSLWTCDCECGERVTGKTTAQLRGGHTRSCGCLQKDWAKIGGQNRRHGRSRSPEYYIWYSMISRCTRISDRAYPHYGGRGIRVCQRWRESFAAFFEDVGPRPSLLHSLDRFPDMNGNYEPGNVRWATVEKQNRNRRNNLILEMGGERFTLAEWSEKVGIGATTISNRLKKGWSVEEALTIPTPRQRNLLKGNGRLPDGEDTIADLQRRFAGMRGQLALLAGEEEAKRLMAEAWKRFAEI